MQSPLIEAFFDEDTSTISYLVTDAATRDTAIIDPVLDFNPASGRTSSDSAEKLVSVIEEKQLNVKWILETHAHADHLSAAQWLQQKYSAPICIGEKITTVQKVFNSLFNLKQQVANAKDFDRLLADNESLDLGSLAINVIHSPGHTPACVCYQIGNAVFVGDTLFMPDYGSARCDFPGGDAAKLFDSTQKIFALGDDTRLFMCHDYRPNGRDALWETTVSEQKTHNIHLHQGISKQEFIQMRTNRDKTLSPPRLILPAIQLNIRAGKMPVAEDNGTQYLKIPLNKI